MRYVRQEVELRALVEHRVVPATSENLFEYPLLFTHGRRSFRWNAAERKALADYIANGGFLFADAICASPEFATSFRSGDGGDLSRPEARADSRQPPAVLQRVRRV